MKKTIIAWGIASALILSTMIPSAAVFFSFVSEAAELVENGFYYTVMEGTSGKTARINYYSGTEEKLSIPDTLGGMPVTEIDFDGRMNSRAFTEIHLSKGILAKEQLYSSLASQSRLSSITVTDDNPQLAAKEGVLFTKDFSVLTVYPQAKTDTSYAEPNTVKKSYGFSGNSFLKEITFSSNREYTTIGGNNCAFSSIEKAVIPANVTKIGESAFEGCKNLREIQWGGNETVIGLRAFFNCTALTKVILPESVKRLEPGAFSNCRQLKTIRLPRGLTYIGRQTFSDTPALKKIMIPDSVLKIGFGAFDRCKAKVIKAPYLKKIVHKYQGGLTACTYSARAAVTKREKIKKYAAANITRIKAVKKTVNMKRGEKNTLKTIVFIKGKKKGMLDSSILSYSSSNKTIAKVTKKGVVKGIKKGTAKIQVKLRTTGKCYRVKVRVKS